MSKKILIECSKCNRVNEAKISLFSKKKISCFCGNVIDVMQEKYKTINCEHCGNTVVYDSSREDNPTCPVCKQKLLKEDHGFKLKELICPECSCHLVVNVNDGTTICPICDKKIDIVETLKKQEIQSENQPLLLKCQAGSEICVWKHNVENFPTNSQIIVNESQVGILLKDGKMIGKFGPGRHSIDFKHEILNGNNQIDENSAVNSQLYFISTSFKANQKWGSDSKIRMFDPLTNLHVELGISGLFNFIINDYEKFLFNIIGVGEIPSTGYKVDEVSMKIRPIVVNYIKSRLPNVIKNNQISVLEVDLHLLEIGDSLKESINTNLSKYGIEIVELIISRIVTPDDDPNFKRMKEQYAEQYLLVKDEQIKKNVALAQQQRRIVEVQTDAQEEIILAQAKAEAYRLQAQAEAQEMQMKGYTYQQETQRMVGLAAVENQSGNSLGGNITGMVRDIVGLGVTLGAVNGVVGMTKDAIAPITNSTSNFSTTNTGWNCSCGQANIATNFCPNCGSKKTEVKTGWDCSCGTKNILSPFCPNCGQKKIEKKTVWTCPNCGKTDIESKFCPECGESMPQRWDCPNCGTKDIKSNFCFNCGRKKD